MELVNIDKVSNYIRSQSSCSDHSLEWYKYIIHRFNSNIELKFQDIITVRKCAAFSSIITFAQSSFFEKKILYTGNDSKILFDTSYLLRISTAQLIQRRNINIVHSNIYISAMQIAVSINLSKSKLSRRKMIVEGFS